jgi:hypothetical protein
MWSAATAPEAPCAAPPRSRSRAAPTPRPSPWPTFGSGGRVTTDFARAGGSFDEARALVVQGSKLVAAGNVGPFFDFGLARYKADGTLDRSFGSGGKVTTDFGC